MSPSLINKLAPTGTLRAGLNMANFLLITGTTDNGEPDGVSPDLARAIASDLGIEATMVPFKGPGEVADAVAENLWDIGNIAAEPERAKTVTFTQAYCEIQATYLLPPDSPLQSVADVDAPGTRIAVKERAAYDLWLTDNISHATLHRAESIDGSFELFAAKKLDALAGLRPALIKQQQLMPGSRILDESFTAVQQSVGCRPGDPEVAEYLNHFVRESIANGLIQQLIEKHGVTGRLSAAPLE
ncbi:MAG: ABC transporter substrate-binding protein [Pseudomonadota bacterium]